MGKGKNKASSLLTEEEAFGGKKAVLKNYCARRVMSDPSPALTCISFADSSIT